MIKKTLIIFLCALTLFTYVSCDRPAKQNDERTSRETLREESADTENRQPDTDENSETLREEVDGTVGNQTETETVAEADTDTCTDTETETEADTDTDTNTETNTESSSEGQPEVSISEEEALEIAKKYWSQHTSDKYIFPAVNTDRTPDSVYVFVLKHPVYIGDGEIHHYSTVDEVWIDRVSGEAMPPYDFNRGLFCDYETILSIYTVAVSYFTSESTNLFDSLKIIKNIENGFKDDKEKEQFEDVVFSSYKLFPGKGSDQYSFYKGAVGYDKKDLNGDGIEELVLLNGDYSIVALFSTVDGQPILLDNYTEHRICQIDGKGLIHAVACGDADGRQGTVYRIAEGGECLEELFGFGIDGHTLIGETLTTNYYKVENGSKQYIGKDEYNSIVTRYHEYLENKTATEVNKTLSSLQFHPLDGELHKFSSYEDILSTVKEMTHMYNYYKAAEFTREGTEWLYDLSTDENRKMYELLDGLVSTYYPPALGWSSQATDAFAYAIKDLDGDGTDELIFIEGDRFDAFAIFTQKDGKTVLSTDYSFDRPSEDASHRLNYWINTVHLDLKPLFPSSQHFDLGALRLKASLALSHAMQENPRESIWIPDEEGFVESLWNYVVPSVQKPLGEIENSGFAFVDLDGDTVDELVIATGEEIVVLYSSYCVNLYRATAAEFQKHLDDRGISDISFSSLDELWGDKLSPYDALEIAREHWKNRLDADEELDVEIGVRTIYFTHVVPENVYILFLYSKSDSNTRYRDEVWVDVFTGEIYQFAK